ncbi:MAG: tripartite tricarboxylate transporter substrate binding protein [Betaproteobacteria bacterium]|nr:tripartite tricarboxylate transporter substrate binding protein [Betaproteobacteria bacterium]
MKRETVIGICFILLWLAAAGAVYAQAYPARPVRMIVPVPPGGSVDVVARIVGQRMSELMGQNVVIEHRPGASTNIGNELVARAAPDGYTLVINTIPLVVNPSMFAKLSYNVEKDFAPVSLVVAYPFVLAVHPSVPAKSVKELIALAKAHPGKLNYSSAGNGTNLHVAAELFKGLSGTDIVHVPYAGGGPALVAVLSGESDLSFLALVAVLSHINAGKLRALGVTGRERTAVLPNVPAIAEAGVPGYEFTSWVGILAPAATPRNIVAALNGYAVKAARTPAVSERFAREGGVVIASSPAEFGAHIRTELARWAKVVKESGMRAD